LLARQGTTLTQGLAPTPMCAPSRASLLTGQYAHNHGVLTVEGAGGGFRAFDDRRALPVWLQRAGYETMFAGKYVNGYGLRDPRYVPPGWDRWRASVDMSTYSFVHTRFNVDGTVVQPPGYSTDILARYTEEMLAQHRHGPAHDDPFFLWVNYVAPHHGGPHESDDPPRDWPRGRELITTTPAPRDRNTFSDAALPRDPAMWERDLRGNPHAGPRVSGAYKAAMREVHQQRLESLQA
ncbi:sulfatase-like hydrolase/transferase, partial [Nocardioides hankookensis]